MAIGGTSVVTLTGLVVGVAALVLNLVVPRTIIKTALRNLLGKFGDPGASDPTQAVDPELAERQLLLVFINSHVIALALLEGAAFLNLMAYMLEGKALSLVLAVLLLGRLISSFPMPEKLEAWLDQRKLELVDLARSGL